METGGNTVLVTGGATGIGFALAKAFLEAGNRVLICGRRMDRLEEAGRRLPGLDIHQCDLSIDGEREDFSLWADDNYPELNILVNNAGVQKNIDLQTGLSDLLEGDDEIRINLEAVVYLSAFFTPLFLKTPQAAIVNISSGLGFVPIASMPVYCATKAAVHSFTVSMRYQLRHSNIGVFEIIPPMVNTELGGMTAGGIAPSEVAAATLDALKSDMFEVSVGHARGLVEGSRSDFEHTFLALNGW